MDYAVEWAVDVSDEVESSDAGDDCAWTEACDCDVT